MSTTSTASPLLVRRIPPIGRALIAFWGVILLGFCTSIARLAWLGPPETKTLPAVPVIASKKATPVLAAETKPASRDAKPTLARPVTQGPRLAIVLNGFGYSAELAEQALASLPPQVGFAVSPYVANLPDLMQRAYADGHEIYLTLPMQGAGPDQGDAGPHALGYGHNASADMLSLEWSLSRVPNAIGVLASDPSANIQIVQSSPAFVSTPDFRPIANALAKREFLILADPSETKRQVRGMNLTDVLGLDDSASTIDDELAALSEQAHGDTPVVVVSDTITPVGLSRLAAWLSHLGEQGVALVAPSALVDNGEPATTATP
ncbi:divergent polysaccharide deacetylase family protein [Kozakia baliensis]|uniref:divergent polysaccharide deacetylase family protein n=1 Tax=Kozakia baliensis TaxID=153496 RepID=UPI0013142F4B|nr:divergent polysaccharide deacetylase family protein [Kozakia baliensis]